MKIKFNYSIPYDRMLTDMSEMSYDETQEEEIKDYIQRLNKFLERNSLLDKVVKEIEKVSGLKFKNKNLDCFIVKNMKYFAFSHPLTIKMNENFESLKGVLVHELIHILVVDHGVKISELLNSNYSEENLDFKIHLPVLLVQKKVLENLFGTYYFKKVLREEEDCEGLEEIWSRVDKIKFERDVVGFLKNESS